MVGIVENFTVITGKVLALKTSTDSNVPEALELALQGKEKYKHYPDLINSSVGEKIKINLPANGSKKWTIGEGSIIHALVRAAPGNKYFIVPGSIEVVE